MLYEMLYRILYSIAVMVVRRKSWTGRATLAVKLLDRAAYARHQGE